MPLRNNHIDYVEFKALDLDKIKSFYQQVFGWTFTEYGLTYIAFSESGLAGGFEKTDEAINNGALVVLYHNDLVAIKESILKFEGRISKDIFSFPGGKRFHFMDPSGNELAIWCDK